MLSVTIQVNAVILHNFRVACAQTSPVFCWLFMVVASYETADEFPKCNHSNEFSILCLKIYLNCDRTDQSYWKEQHFCFKYCSSGRLICILPLISWAHYLRSKIGSF